MNISSSRKHSNKLYSVIVLLCILVTIISLNPVTTVKASTDLITHPPKESSISCVPTITFTEVPAFGTLTNAILKGKVECVVGKPSDYSVVVLIYPGDDGLEKLYFFEFESGIDDPGDPAQEYGELQKLFHNSNWLEQNACK